jgi:hypothetical protein
LKLLDLSSNFIADFPAAMVKKLKSLDRLLLRKNSVQSLEKDSFQVKTGLEYGQDVQVLGGIPSH